MKSPQRMNRCLKSYRFLRWQIFVYLLGFTIQPSLADDYVGQVKPILQARCFPCHGALKQEAGLRLDTIASMRMGGESGTVLDSDKPDLSLLLQRIRNPDPNQRMPPEGEPLSPQQIDRIESWIKGGAVPPEVDLPQSDPREHWAFQKPKQAALPEVSIPRETNIASASSISSSQNPIDRFLALKHQQLGVQPLELADRLTLIRRLFIDLLGVPPQPDEVRKFTDDNSPDAYEKLVDQLLTRPEYGERWGRHWMDVWRYSDWYGRRAVPDVMNSYPQIWRWRDWIVRSLNEDKGYDRMLMEMLAADELCPTEDENVVATGFLVRNWYKWNYETWMKDNVEHTGKAFLGLTLNCAHCHDHKYDPITHEDYFRFRAFFEPLELRHDRVAEEADPGPFRKYVYAESYGPIKTGAIRVFDEKLDAQTFMYSGGDARNRLEGKPPVAPGPPRSLCETEFIVEPVNLDQEAFYPGLRQFVRQDELKRCTAELEQAKAACVTSSQSLETAASKLAELRMQASGPVTAANHPTFESLKMADHAVLLARSDVKIATANLALKQAKLNSHASRIAADDARYRAIGNAELLAKLACRSEKQTALALAEHSDLVAEKALVSAEHKLAAVEPADEAKLNAAKQEVAKAEQNYQLARKSTDSARTSLNANDEKYSAISPIYPVTSTGRRLALARWIVHRDNPLTARVAVNHIWLRHFGQAFVETTDNFGIQGKLPEHQEILDWLAVELMESGWSMKHIHRIMLTSHAYKRRSTAPPDYPSQKVDVENRSYWRAATRRMEAEVVRDSVLACAGSLDKTIGGPEIDPVSWHSIPRRSLYFTIHGESKMQFLDTFDGPNVCDCYRRTSTVLPQQALAMTNGELLVNYGRILAQRISHEIRRSENVEEIDQRFINEAFERVINRPPTVAEIELSQRFLRQQHQLLSSTSVEQLRLEGTKGIAPASSDLAQRARENLTISLFSHNDFVTVR